MSSFMSRFGLSSGTKKTSESPAAPKQQLNTSIGMGANQNSRNAYMGTSAGPVKANTQIGGQYTQGIGYSSNPPSQINKQQHLLTISNMGGAGGGNSTYLDSSAMYNNQSNIYSIQTEIDRMPSS